MKKCGCIGSIPILQGTFILIKFFYLVQGITIYNVVSSTYSGKSKIYTSRVGNKFYSTLSSSDKKDEEFYKWFVGFADGESNFTIVFQKDTNGNITGASFRFIIELHIDDIDTLKYIKSKLNLAFR